MTPVITASRVAGFAARASQPTAQRARHRSSVPTQSLPPSCSLKARPAPHPGPAPSWEELLGQR